MIHDSRPALYPIDLPRNPVATTNISALSLRLAGGFKCWTLVKRFFSRASKAASVPPCSTLATKVLQGGSDAVVRGP